MENEASGRIYDLVAVSVRRMYDMIAPDSPVAQQTHEKKLRPRHGLDMDVLVESKQVVVPKDGREYAHVELKRPSLVV